VRCAAAGGERVGDGCGRRQHSIFQRSGHGRAVAFGSGNDCVERLIRGETIRAREATERGYRTVVVQREVEIELHVTPRIETYGVDDSQARAVEEKTPVGAVPHRMCDGDPPQAVEWLAP